MKYSSPRPFLSFLMNGSIRCHRAILIHFRKCCGVRNIVHDANKNHRCTNRAAAMNGNANIKRLTRVNRRWLFGLLIIIIGHFIRQQQQQHNGDCVSYTSCTGSRVRAIRCGRVWTLIYRSFILTFQLKPKETRRERGRT